MGLALFAPLIFITKIIWILILTSLLKRKQNLLMKINHLPIPKPWFQPSKISKNGTLLSIPRYFLVMLPLIRLKSTNSYLKILNFKRHLSL